MLIGAAADALRRSSRASSALAFKLSPSSRKLCALATVPLGWTAVNLLGRLREADLAGQVVLITGGSRGLGFLLAREFGREGCRVAICARDAERLRHAQQDLEQQGIEVFARTCDIANRAEVDHFVEAATEHYGQVDVLVNNAGIIQMGAIQSMTQADFEQAMAVMFWGVVYPTLALLPRMLERHQGRIVNITSIGGKVSAPHLLPYSSAKFAAVGFSEGLRAELAPEGISVTTIVPGFMRTGSHLNAVFKGQEEREFALFALAATLPFISMDAERAARQIVRACKRGKAQLIMSLPAALSARFHGAFPGTTTRLLSLGNRILLPRSVGGQTTGTRGHELSRRMESRVFDMATTLGRRAAERFHE